VSRRATEHSGSTVFTEVRGDGNADRCGGTAEACCAASSLLHICCVSASSDQSQAPAIAAHIATSSLFCLAGLLTSIHCLAVFVMSPPNPLQWLAAAPRLRPQLQQQPAPQQQPTRALGALRQHQQHSQRNGASGCGAARLAADQQQDHAGHAAGG
jgi:hypothetical protein